ncbi:MAG: hypothetical protein AUK21_03560 [Parcubacteria group bacterium CG2_30_48_51]|nr:MAG: hypothetical protein AUK21_03560 [Parcubacteria group bacterium CG2_30_48_51]
MYCHFPNQKPRLRLHGGDFLYVEKDYFFLLRATFLRFGTALRATFFLVVFLAGLRFAGLRATFFFAGFFFAGMGNHLLSKTFAKIFLFAWGKYFYERRYFILLNMKQENKTFVVYKCTMIKNIVQVFLPQPVENFFEKYCEHSPLLQAGSVHKEN